MVDNVDFDVVVCGIFGFSGVDLVNLINIVAFKVAFDGVASVGVKYFDFVKDCILMGVVCILVIIMFENCKLMVYYEGGYVLVVFRTKGARSVYKAIIVSRG